MTNIPSPTDPNVKGVAKTLAYHKGRKGEAYLIKVFEQEYGWKVEDLTKGFTQAPIMTVEEGDLQFDIVLPDLKVTGPEGLFAGECKTYHGPNWFRKGQVWNHGFEYVLFRDYLTFQEHTGIPVKLFVIEQNRSPVKYERLNGRKEGYVLWDEEPCILEITMDEIYEDPDYRIEFNHAGNGDKVRWVFWNRNSMRYFHPYDEYKYNQS